MLGLQRKPRAAGRWFRFRYVSRYYAARIKPALPWLIRSRETSNFTYDLTPRNLEHLAHMLAVATARPKQVMALYLRELLDDAELKSAVLRRVAELPSEAAGIDATAKFGRRVGWYALVRALKPRVVVETGVEKGMGAVVLCAALLRNRAEGHAGRYLGTDIDSAAGMLLCEPYSAMGRILYGDSIESLMALEESVDLFINDSDHSAEYEAQEYRVIEPKLTDGAMIVADNAHVSDELLRFAESSGRKFLFFREEPAEHWYLGAGIGLAYH